MTRPIRETDFLKTLESFRALAIHPEFTDDLAAAIRKEGGADRAVEALLQAFGLADINLFALSVEEQLKRLRLANEEESWGIEESVIMALAESAPPWPEGRLAFRSLRIRWGEGDEGVALTFERHAARIKRTFSPKFWRWEYLRSDNEYLRLLSGNDIHRPTVEWVTLDLDTHRKRSSVEAVRGPKSFADEGLVFSWMFPEYVRAIDYGENPAFFLAGYELDVPEGDGGSWRRVPVVSRDVHTGEVHLIASGRGGDGSGCSVPSVRECRS
ncbi:MAG: hypothetical protein U9Q03_05150 [Patescibacteria group bacterium]|nr:hypothetical protein [Patescibacteria group bacterium]